MVLHPGRAYGALAMILGTCTAILVVSDRPPTGTGRVCIDLFLVAGSPGRILRPSDKNKKTKQYSSDGFGMASHLSPNTLLSPRLTEW